MKALVKNVFVSAALSSTTAQGAECLRLFEWHPGNTLAPLILPVRTTESPEVAAKRYLTQLSLSSDLMQLFKGAVPNLPLQGFKPLTPHDRESRALMIANLPKDYTTDSLRLERFKSIFGMAKHNSYVLPMNTNLGLAEHETSELFQKISEHFPFLVAMGGDDIDPRLYNHENLYSENIIPSRDHFEMQLIKSYVAQEKGFLLGVCRGSQISSAALGYHLIQDVPSHIGTHVSHKDDWHDIELNCTKNNILKSLCSSAKKLLVNSLHHQAVAFKEGGLLEVAAQSSDGVVEATEFKNGRGLLVQFHPELMNNHLGSQILCRVIQQKNRVMPVIRKRLFGT